MFEGLKIKKRKQTPSSNYSEAEIRDLVFARPPAKPSKPHQPAAAIIDQNIEELDDEGEDILPSIHDPPA